MVAASVTDASARGATDRAYFSISEVAARLGVSRVSVWRWISAGRLPVARLGHRTVRIARQDVEKLIRPDSLESALAPVQGDGDAEHLVLFYDADPFLLDSVADFLGSALGSGQRAVMVATPVHRAGTLDRLEKLGIDLSRARREGRLVELDAHQTLGRFMVDGMPDPTRFAAIVRDLVADGIGSGQVRVFGEMVALLVAEGNHHGALALEAQWNWMLSKHQFALLCAYPMSLLGGEELAPVLLDVCAEHGQVVPAESYTALDDPADRLRAIVALQQKAASLEQALLAERAARDQAEAALRVRDEFLSIASHELRTPVTVLTTQAQLSLRRLERTGQLEPERVVQAMRMIGGQADKLGRLISQLLDISRLEAGKLELDPKPTDIVVLVDQLVSATRALTERHTITYTAPASLECEVDALRLEQVVSNLLDNALKYSPDGGAIEVVLAQPTPRSVEISVRDHGLGIPANKRGHIFERFYQAHQSGNRSGMGLGLYVSRQIVELHGGDIRVDFPQDGGTRFSVRLPVARTLARAGEAAD
jgi:excisionase family DNA binding protein